VSSVLTLKQGREGIERQLQEQQEIIKTQAEQVRVLKECDNEKEERYKTISEELDKAHSKIVRLEAKVKSVTEEKMVLKKKTENAIVDFRASDDMAAELQLEFMRGQAALQLDLEEFFADRGDTLLAAYFGKPFQSGNTGVAELDAALEEDHSLTSI
jgi:chromosome segregation ATPase